MVISFIYNKRKEKKQIKGNYVDKPELIKQVINDHIEMNKNDNSLFYPLLYECNIDYDNHTNFNEIKQCLDYMQIIYICLTSPCNL